MSLDKSSHLIISSFLKKVDDCRREYKKQLGDTRDESDAAHFFDPKLKDFINSHATEFNLLFNMNFDKGFMNFCKSWILE